MATLTLTLPKPHSGQRRMRSEARRFNVAACGRRWGKSTLAINLLAEPALAGKPAGYFAPTYKLLLELWRQLERTLRPVLRRVSQQEHRLELITGGVVECWTLEDPDAGRSRKYARAVVDEAGLVRGLLATWQSAIRPTLADLAGDGWFLGSPKGQNDFYTLFERGGAVEFADWQRWQRPTHDNPHIPAAELDALKAELPATVYDQEIMAEFVADGLGLFRPNDLNAAQLGALGTAESVKGRSYVGAIDIGRRQDATVINVADPSAAPFQRVYHERMERVPYPVIQQRIAHAVRAYPGTWYVESNGVGDPVIENLEVAVRPFVTTARSKVQALQALQLLLEQERFKAIWTAQERRELATYAWDDKGLQQDCVMSLAILADALHSPASQILSFYQRQVDARKATV